MPSTLRSGLCVAALYALSAGPAQAAQPVTGTTVVYGSTPSLTIVSNGATVLNLQPGESFTISGTWSAGGLDPNCPDCSVQVYLAGDVNFDVQINLGLDVNWDYDTTGDYSATFTAPSTVGSYVIAGAFSYDYDYVNVIGSPNSSNQVSYLLQVSAVPEPASLCMLGAGVALLSWRQRRRAQAQA